MSRLTTMSCRCAPAICHLSGFSEFIIPLVFHFLVAFSMILMSGANGYVIFSADG